MSPAHPPPIRLEREAPAAGQAGCATTMGIFLGVDGLLISCVLPAVKATGKRLPALGQLGGGTTIRLGSAWTTLVVAQVAIAVALLPMAVFLTMHWVRLAAADPGFEANEFLVARVDLDEEEPAAAEAQAYRENFQRRYQDRFRELIERVESETPVAGVTTMSMEPGAESIRSVEIDGAAHGAGSTHQVRHARVGRNFFATFGVPLLAGRTFTAADLPREDQPNTESQAVVVNRTFASQVFGAGNALGRQVRYLGGDSSRQSGHWHEIVGIVGDLPANPLSPDGVQPRIYHVAAPGREQSTKLAIRVRGQSPDVFGPRLREIAAQVDPAIHLARMRPLPEVYREEQLGVQWGALALTIVTLSVLVLSAAGIFALMSVVVSRRSREIGIRMALGADRSGILRAIFSRVAGQLASGVLAGLVVAALGATALGGDIGTWSVVLAAVAVLTIVVGLVAALGPVRRGLRINPTEALRAE